MISIQAYHFFNDTATTEIYTLSLHDALPIFIGSLSMLIIDKKNDVVTLRNLGANDKQITRVFLFEGRMIAVIGAVIGIGLGLLLCWLQQQYGFVRLGDSEGSFIVNAYPVSVHYSDVAIIFVTVIAVGWLAVWYPVRALSKRLLS